MGMSLALIAIGLIILLDRMGTGHGFREGWPWIVLALGVGGLLRNKKSVPGWVTTLVGVFVLAANYYSIHIRIPRPVRIYFLPVLLIGLGFIWLWKYRS